MLNQGIIEPSVSEWAVPIVPIVKKDGSLITCQSHIDTLLYLSLAYSL